MKLGKCSANVLCGRKCDLNEWCNNNYGAIMRSLLFSGADTVHVRSSQTQWV